jgi:hypothetical protein
MSVVRKEFIAAMELELAKNHHKGSWYDYRPSEADAMKELQIHVNKLQRVLNIHARNLIKEHSADVANCAMKIQEIYG